VDDLATGRVERSFFIDCLRHPMSCKSRLQYMYPYNNQYYFYGNYLSKNLTLPIRNITKLLFLREKFYWYGFCIHKVL